MFVQRFGADVKLYRARQTVGQLEGMQEEYLSSGAIRFVNMSAPDGTDRWLIRIEKELPTAYAPWSARPSTLPEAPSTSSWSPSSSPVVDVREDLFPIAPSAHDFDEELGSRLRRADPGAWGHRR